MESVQIFQVSQLTRRIKEQLETPEFRHVAVEGEISNFTHHASGHMYFTLKDSASRLKCVMFRQRNARLAFRPANGQTVVAVGSIGVYEPSGQYQLNVEQMFSQGIGALHEAYERLREKLKLEGLFDPARKQELPYLPQTVAVITSRTGAAVRDMISVMHRRFPAVEILVIPAQVQGEAAVPSLIRALHRAAARDDVDLIIIGRGGGSIEELWAFNDEQLARTIASCRLPVISAVGHETDFTIADFAADARAATPSAAAEMAVPDSFALERARQQLESSLIYYYRNGIDQRRRYLQFLMERPVMAHPGRYIDQQRQRLDEWHERLVRAGQLLCRRRRESLSRLISHLDAVSPLAVLSRGFAVVQDSDGVIVRSAKQVQKGDSLRVTLNKGRLYCTVDEGEDHGAFEL